MNRASVDSARIGIQPPTSVGEGMGAPFKVFDFSDADFRRLQRMIFDYAGITLNDNKKPMAYSRLTKRLRQLGLGSFREYLDLVESSGSEEHVRFINALTTNLTYFFREAHHFTILAEHLLKLSDGEPLTVWSAACSTGEEPYSIAMAAIEAFGSDTPPVRIIASDLDTDALATAERGVYAAEKVTSLSPQRLKRFFLKGTGDQTGFARVRPQVQRLVEFRQINLHESGWQLGSTSPLAAIFCRNVMIYFSKETQTRVLDRFAPLLRKDGLLFAGHSENFFYNGKDTFRIRGKTVYELAT